MIRRRGLQSRTLVRSLRKVEPPLRQCKQKHLFGLRAGGVWKVEVGGGIAPTLEFHGPTLGHGVSIGTCSRRIAPPCRYKRGNRERAAIKPATALQGVRSPPELQIMSATSPRIIQSTDCPWSADDQSIETILSSRKRTIFTENRPLLPRRRPPTPSPPWPGGRCHLQLLPSETPSRSSARRKQDWHSGGQRRGRDY
jgi:hypothetical protein